MNIGEYNQLPALIRVTVALKVFDLLHLTKQNVSLPKLLIHNSTSGHAHDAADEVYFFIDGVGTIEIDGEKFKVKPGDMITVPGGKFHKVYNEGDKDLNFWTVFEKYEGRGK